MISFIFFYQTGNGGNLVAGFGEAHEDNTLGGSLETWYIFKGKLDDLGFVTGQDYLIGRLVDKHGACYVACPVA